MALHGHDGLQRTAYRQALSECGPVVRAALLATCLAGLPWQGGTSRANGAPPDASLRASNIFADPEALDPRVPAPQSVLGHEIGDDAARYEPMSRYLHALVEASPRVALNSYGQSHEGRTLFYVTITSEANQARLDAIRSDAAKLADPRKVSDTAEADAILERLPAIAWLAYSIHGDELSSTDAALQVAYELAARHDESTQALLRDVVVHIDPLMNPDGRERYLGQLQHLRGRIPNPDHQAMQHQGLWAAGRGNHYLFDLNRDWVSVSQPETRGRVAQILAWNPHLLVDSHEMGPLETYLFDPPGEPLNPHLAPENLEWRRKFSAEQAEAFDRFAWSYYSRDWYEEWYPGYTNAWANLLDMIGLLYEQAGVNGAAVKQSTGHVLTYREAVEHQFVSTIANLRTLQRHRREILTDYLKARRHAVNEDGAGQTVFIVAPTADPARRAQFLDLMGRHGLEVFTSRSELVAKDLIDVWGKQAESRRFPAGSLVMLSAQPHRRLLHALLDFDPHMTAKFLTEERSDVENRRGSNIYDVTAWNVGMAFGLEACWGFSVNGAELVKLDAAEIPATAASESPGAYGYLFDGASSDVYLALARLLAEGAIVRAAEEPFTVRDSTFAAGTVLLRRHENGPDLDRLVGGVSSGLHGGFVPVESAQVQTGPDLGGNRFHLLVEPRVAIASQRPISSTSFGAIWHLLDTRTELRSSPIHAQQLADLDLRKYNVLLLPDADSEPGLKGLFHDAAIKRLRTWVEDGGTLIAIGDTAAYLAREEVGLTQARRKRDVLDRLEAFEEAGTRERAAQRPNVDAEAIWGGRTEPTAPVAEPPPDPPAHGASVDVAERKSSTETSARQRRDEWERLFAPKGVIAAASLDPRHWLCYGLENRLGVFLSGSTALVSMPPVRAPVRLAPAGEIRLSGLMWPEARARWADTAYATTEPVGYGQVVLFVSEPFFRSTFEAGGRLLLNAVFLGPSLGANPSTPW